MPKKKDGGLKSALELAMERLEEEGMKTPKLTAEQKKRIQEIEKKYEAKIAEIKIIREREIQAAALAGDAEKMQQLQQQLVKETSALREKLEGEKEKIWKEKQPDEQH